jgi:PAS domain S-box-containing protein
MASNRDDLDRDELLARLREAEETLDAIRRGEVDALVVAGASGQQIYTLQNADRPYRALIERMQEGAVTLSTDGTILYCNDRFAAMCGSPRGELIGTPLAWAFAGSARTALLQLLSQAGGSGASGELVLTNRIDTPIPVNVSLIELTLDDDANPVICGVITDLTMSRWRSDQLAAANAQLASEIEERRRAEESLHLALDAAGMGSWDLDLLTGRVRRTLRHDQIFGYSTLRPQWTLSTALAHFVPEDRGSVEATFSTAKDRGALEFEGRITRADDGSIRWLRVTGRTFYDGPVPIRIAGVVVDITDRRAVEERLRQSQKIEAIGRLIGGVAHDFNNLLMVISGGLDMINRPSLPARRERVLAGMRQAVERGSALSRQLLAFSRRQALRPEPIDLLRQISGMEDLLDRSLGGDIQVRLDFPVGLWPVKVDPGELELAVLNLTVNARDAMPTGGVITIHAENAENVVEEGLRGDFVKLSVVDTGTGMPPDVLARVFEPFFTTKEIGKGSGLGLAQTLGFVQASGGAVRIESSPGRGTTVTLLLPRTQAPPIDRAEDAATSGLDQVAPEAAGRLLLVEDDNEVAALTTEMIEQLGYQTTRVASAEAALDVLADNRAIDIVFSDVMMPGTMNGLDLAREIRVRRQGLPVVLTSGYAEAVKHKAESERIGLLRKPYRLDELAEALKLARVTTAGGSR